MNIAACVRSLFSASLSLIVVVGFASLAAAQELVNGGMVSGSISVAGESDVYTFTANQNDGIQLRVADLSSGGLNPRIILTGPNLAIISNVPANDVAAIVHTATISGVYTVEVEDSSNTATGNYRLYYTRAPGANEGGALVNGSLVSDTIDKGDLDSFTFAANQGEGVQIRAVDQSGSLLNLRLSLYAPGGGLIQNPNGADVAAIVYTATVTGTFTIVVSDVSSGLASVGAYDLHFTRAPGANEGGALPNGGFVTGKIDKGDLDSYTFTASQNEGLQLRVADISNSTFAPRLTLYSPSGSTVTNAIGGDVAAIATTAPATGTYTVVVDDASSGQASVGDYNLYFARAPGANEGGALISGGLLQGTIDKGDLDSFTLAVNQGENVQIQAADLSGTALNIRMALYGPDGGLITNPNGADVASLVYTAAVTGTYTLIVYDVSSGSASTGNYDLYYVRAPGANEGGALPNGGMVSDVIDKGDLDSYTFSASQNQGVQLKIADLSGGALNLRMTIYQPDGKTLTTTNGADAALSTFAAPATGTYTIVVGDVSPGQASTGAYNLSFARAPVASAGQLLNGVVRNEQLGLGELDSFSFVGAAGQTAQFTITDTSGGALTPRLSLYSPAGVLIQSVQNAMTATLNVPLTVGGQYTVIVTDVSSGLASTGSYTLSLNGSGASASEVPVPPWAAGAAMLLLGTVAMVRRGSRRSPLWR